MNRNRLVIAIVLLLGLTGAVVTTMRSHESETTLEKPAVSLPKVNKDEVTELEIQNPKKSLTVTFKKEESGWVLTAPVAAKADQSAVDSALDKLAELEVVGTAATRKENYERLEIDDANALRVLAKAKDKTVADLYIGAGKSGGTMVRVAGQDPVLRVRGSIRYPFDKEVKLFRDRVVLDIESKELTGLQIKSEKGSFKFEKPSEDEKWAQALAKGEKPIQRFSDSKVQSLVSTLARLRASDFAAADVTPESAGLEPPAATAVLTKTDGSQVTLELGKQHEESKDYYVRVAGGEQIYRISKYTAERVITDATGFQEPEKKADEAPAPAANHDDGPSDIPPEVLKQLQQQLGQAGHGH